MDKYEKAIKIGDWLARNNCPELAKYVRLRTYTDRGAF